MNPGSPDKRSEEMNNLRKEDESTFDGKLDLNLSVNKEEGYEGYDQYNEAWGDRMDLNQQGQHGSPLLLSDVRCARQEPPFMESGSPVQSELIYGETGNLEFNDDPESLYPSLKDNQCLETTKEVCSRESRDFVNSSSPVDKDVLHTETQAGDSADYSGKSPSTKDMNCQGEGMEEDNIHLYGSDSPPIDENLKEDSDKYSGNLQYEKIESVYEEEEGGGTDDNAQKSLSPLMVQYRGDETMKDDFHSGRLLSENETLDIRHSGMQSPGKTLNGSASPVRQISASFERAPYRHQSSSQKPSPSPKDIQDLSYSPKSPKRKDLSSDRHGGGSKRIPSEDHLSPARQTFASPRRHLQESKRRSDSPQKRLSMSPRRRHSPSDHRRQDRSVSRSPSRHTDSSSRYRRDNRYRSRSRSPYVRNRYRGSPRRRYSPKRRSPPSGYHSRRHSSRRRPWSPPPNRNNGIGRPGSNLFVAGFGFMTTERDLERKFSRFGRVKDIRIVRDRRTGESRGFGFLSLERDEDADAAIRALDQTEWNGRVVLVEKSKTPTH